MNIETTTSRRKFIGASCTILAGSLLAGSKILGAPAIIKNLGRNHRAIAGVSIGTITYSFRDMPDQSPEAVLSYVKECGLTAVELMGNHAEPFAGAPENPVDFSAVSPILRKRFKKQELTEEEQKIAQDFDEQREAYRQELAKWRESAPIEKFQTLGRMYKNAGIEIYAFKPSTFGPDNQDYEIAYGFNAAKALGANHVTLEHPSDDAHTLKLGKMAEQFGMKVGYHGHEQQTPTFWDTALAQSPANMLNLDLGHYVAAGNYQPLDIIKSKHQRIASMHLKDRQTPAHGKANLMWGEGDTPIIEALQLIRDQEYNFPVTVEMEYQVPEGSNPVMEVKRCLEYCKTALS